MKNNIEILRSILFTKDDLANITNLGDAFSAKEIEFMEEFKKIYELGLGQLQKFIDKIDKEGSELDTYSILYYIQVLQDGPLGQFVREFSKDKKFFVDLPDILGLIGNNNYSPQNTVLYAGSNYPLGCAVDSFNKLPKFMQNTMATGIKGVEEVFRGSLKSSLEIDNTLPIVDKKPQDRYNEEEFGEWVLKANGTFLVKDSYKYLSTKMVSEKIFKKVEDDLGEDHYRVYKDKKQYDPFSNENESTSTNLKIEKEIIEGDKVQVVTLDLMGDVFDSEERRGSVLRVSNAAKDKDYLLNTVEGQLGI